MAATAPNFANLKKLLPNTPAGIALLKAAERAELDENTSAAVALAAKKLDEEQMLGLAEVINSYREAEAEDEKELNAELAAAREEYMKKLAAHRRAVLIKAVASKRKPTV